MPEAKVSQLICIILTTQVPASGASMGAGVMRMMPVCRFAYASSTACSGAAVCMSWQHWGAGGCHAHSKGVAQATRSAAREPADHDQQSQVCKSSLPIYMQTAASQ